MRLSAILVLASGCAREIFDFDISHSADATIPGQIEGLEPQELDPEMFGDADAAAPVDTSKLDEYGVTAEDVSRVEVVSLVLERVTPEPADLSFFDRVEVWLGAADQPDLLLSSYDAFAEGDVWLDLPVDGQDLKPYLFAEGGAWLSTVPSGIQPPEDTTIRTTLTVQIGVTVAGVLHQVQ